MASEFVKDSYLGEKPMSEDGRWQDEEPVSEDGRWQDEESVSEDGRWQDEKSVSEDDHWQDEAPVSEDGCWRDEELIPLDVSPPPTGSKFTARSLAEGAMMSALALILAVISMYVPILSLVAPLVFPVPLALLVLRHGLRLGSLSAVSVLLLSSIMLGLPQAVFLFMQFGFLGLFFGWCFRRQKKAAFTLTGGVLLSSLAILASLLFPTIIVGVSIDQYQEMSSAMLNEYVNALQQQGANTDMVMGGMSPAAYVAYMEEMLRHLMPSLLIGSAMMLTMLCYLLMCKLLRRFGYNVNKLPPFTEWRLDWHLLWVLIAVMAMAGVGRLWGNDLLVLIGDNLYQAFQFVLLVCGISMLGWLLKGWRVATFIKVLIVLFTLQMFGNLAVTILVFAGMFDPIFDFRRRVDLLRERRKG